MGRPHRAAKGGFVYHVLIRGNARMQIFDDEGDYDAFETVLAEAVERGSPFGGEAWTERTLRALDLQSTMRLSVSA